MSDRQCTDCTRSDTTFGAFNLVNAVRSGQAAQTLRVNTHSEDNRLACASKQSDVAVFLKKL